MTTSTDFASWYRGLDARARDRYANRAGTSAAYIEKHLLKANRIPRPRIMVGLADASGHFTLSELATWFYETSLSRKPIRRRRSA